MLLACYSHKHISYRIRTIIRKAILNCHTTANRHTATVSQPLTSSGISA
ncbi:hypothetical protein [Wolbachia endosymbiont (group A) of Aleiodes leptofemur]